MTIKLSFCLATAFLQHHLGLTRTWASSFPRKCAPNSSPLPALLRVCPLSTCQSWGSLSIDTNWRSRSQLLIRSLDGGSICWSMWYRESYPCFSCTNCQRVPSTWCWSTGPRIVSACLGRCTRWIRESRDFGFQFNNSSQQMMEIIPVTGNLPSHCKAPSSFVWIDSALQPLTLYLSYRKGFCSAMVHETKLIFTPPHLCLILSCCFIQFGCFVMWVRDTFILIFLLILPHFQGWWLWSVVPRAKQSNLERTIEYRNLWNIELYAE